MRFKNLNIERDPKDQVFEEATYDLVMMGNVQKLFEPRGGRVALIEGARLVPFEC